MPFGAASAGETDNGFLGSASDLAEVTASGGELVHEPSGSWFIELTEEPAVRGGQRAQLRQQRARLLADAAELDADVDVRYTYDRLWNGISVDASEADIARIRGSREVAAVYPVATVQAPEPQDTVSPAMESALGMTGADVAQSELGLDGAGLRVAVIDSGIDYDHPDFGGSGIDGGTDFPTGRVPYGYDFVGDAYNADSSSPAYNPVPAPDDDPDDCGGHGTHVAGIVGADGDTTAGGVRGVAPAAELGAYRVFGCDGSTTADIILAALEMAHADGMDVVNMSLGAGFATWPQYPTAAASDALVDEGVVVVASIGNSGASGTWSAGAPGVGEKVIGVASFDNVRYDARAFTASPDDRPFPYSPATGAPEPPADGSLPMSRTGTTDSPTDACTAEGPLPDLTGTAALIRRGECPFHEKAVNAQNAGAEAVVLYNNVPGSFAPTVAGEPAVTIPVVAVSQADGHELDARIAAGDTTLTWTEETVTVENPTGGLISSFSSYGMTAELDLKPDLGAPGGLIRSTYPLEEGGYGLLSGTSMSSPHVAGAVALLLQARPDLEPGQVRDLLQNHAVPADWSLIPDSGYIEPVHRQGAGMLAIDTAILADTSLTPGKLSLGESENGPVTTSVTVRNDGDADVVYELSHVDAITTADEPNDPGFYLGGASVEFAVESLTVPAGGEAAVEVTITAPDGPEFGQYGGYLLLTPEDGDTLRVPFAGLVGDYQSLTVLTGAGAGLPALAAVTQCDRFVGNDCTMNGVFGLLPDGASFGMSGPDDMPAILVHREYPVEKLTLELFKARKDGSAGAPFGGKNNNTVLELDYLGRSGTATGFNAYVWDGTRSVGRRGVSLNVPDGDYVLRLTVVKPLGDPENPDHVETWDSPVITVDRG
ncbi:S8 family serine peptidase [Phytoactinopolyspora alkaliphila]|uniref:S8 family serine peptidase n=2 Tax=Phytoactinopolyspora alkaliphila TaxID=1783498 RepID=A0A6N9YR45_9ACTN|nr:S8 family serine peptidase [Phytoactinopolyspora alkaliphila]NED97400.1 S8 family serine peptidase [Phytoactinopolyspora alkaliphila]